MKRTTVALVAGPVIAAGTALWLFTGATSSMTKAQRACHDKVSASESLPTSARFIDSEKRATGDVIVVRGEASAQGRPSVAYSCTVRGAAGGALDVQLASSR